MAQIIENKKGRRMVKVSTNDIISIVREYQQTIKNANSYDEIRRLLNNTQIYLPEDL